MTSPVDVRNLYGSFVGGAKNDYSFANSKNRVFGKVSAANVDLARNVQEVVSALLNDPTKKNTIDGAQRSALKTVQNFATGLVAGEVRVYSSSKNPIWGLWFRIVNFFRKAPLYVDVKSLDAAGTAFGDHFVIENRWGGLLFKIKP